MLFDLTPDAIDLAFVVTRHGRQLKLSHRLRFPTEADWIAYDRALAVAVQDSGEGTRVLDNSVSAACVLYDAIALDVTGYRGIQDVPPAHKVRVAELLRAVGPADPDGPGPELFEISAEEDLVVLKAVRGETYPRLVHHFTPPTIPQRIEYERLKADAMIVRGTKQGTDRIVLPSRLARILRFYDQLVLAVEGYIVGDHPPFGREEIVRVMDAQHKAAAVALLFDTGEILEPKARKLEPEEAPA